MVSFLTFFFNYSQKEALLIVFVPIFGAACGNFLNLMRQTDPITKTPVVMIRSAILACPVMIIGSVVGLMINKLLPGRTHALSSLFFGPFTRVLHWKVPNQVLPHG